MVAVLAVVALVGALLFIGRQPVGNHAGDLAGGNFSSLPGANSTPFPPATGSPTSHTKLRTSPAPTTRNRRHGAASRASHRAPHRTTPPATAAAPPVLPVTVLNNSRIQGLAHHVAAEFEARGWPIAKIGNFTGRLPQTTVFYVAGEQAAAQRLAEQFPGYGGIAQLEPRPADLPGTGLTVVLTRYWES